MEAETILTIALFFTKLFLSVFLVFLLPLYILKKLVLD